MDYPETEKKLMIQRGYKNEQSWAKYRLSLKRALKEKRIHYERNESTIHLEEKMSEIIYCCGGCGRPLVNDHCPVHIYDFPRITIQEANKRGMDTRV